MNRIRDAANSRGTKCTDEKHDRSSVKDNNMATEPENEMNMKDENDNRNKRRAQGEQGDARRRLRHH